MKKAIAIGIIMMMVFVTITSCIKDDISGVHTGQPNTSVKGAREWEGATRNMTLDDVRAIAQKIGTDLTLGDLRDFIGTDIGSGLYIIQYRIEGTNNVLNVGSGGTDPTAVPLYAMLTYDVDRGDPIAIDIRYYDVDKFLHDGTREQIRPRVRVTIEEWDGISADALEPIYEDEYVKYSLSSIRSANIMLTFEDGTRLSLKDAISQDKIGIEDLILNGLHVYKEEK